MVDYQIRMVNHLIKDSYQIRMVNHLIKGIY